MKGEEKKVAAANKIEEQRRLARIRELAAPLHAKAKKAGLTENEIRKDVKKVLKEIYDTGKNRRPGYRSGQ